MTACDILAVRDLRVSYAGTEVVHGVSFTLPHGGIVGIVGESGSGKSTVAKTLIGLHREYSGTIEYPLGKPRLAMIFQDAVGSLNPRMTVRSTLEEVLRLKRRGAEKSPSPAELLSQVGLSEAVLEQYPREMSGGQCQRVSVARALASNPEILIADEPVSALDVSVQARLLNLLRELRIKLGISILLIAHDLAVVKNICDQVSVMERGRLVDQGETERVFANPKSDYTRKLLAAVPRVRA